MVYLVFTATQLPTVEGVRWILLRISHIFTCWFSWFFFTDITTCHHWSYQKKRSTGNSVWCSFLALSFWTNSHAISTDQSREKNSQNIYIWKFLCVICSCFAVNGNKDKLQLIFVMLFFGERKRIRTKKKRQNAGLWIK